MCVAPGEMMSNGRCLVGACAALAAALTGATARGDAHLAVEWTKLAELLPPPALLNVPPGAAWRAELAEHASLRKPDADPPLLETLRGMGRYSIVARDWDASRVVMGKLAPTDQVRRSRRMVLMRERLLEGPIVPFVQVGLGQWRVDPDALNATHPALLAGQAGAGIELVLSTWAAVAIEADCTFLDPDRTHPPAFWGGFLAYRASF